MDHSLAIRKDPERVWDVPGSETGSRRDLPISSIEYIIV